MLVFSGLAAADQERIAVTDAVTDVTEGIAVISQGIVANDAETIETITPDQKLVELGAGWQIRLRELQPELDDAFGFCHGYSLDLSGRPALPRDNSTG